MLRYAGLRLLNAIPTLLLYEISIISARMIEKKRAEADAERERAEQASSTSTEVASGDVASS